MTSLIKYVVPMLLAAACLQAAQADQLQQIKDRKTLVCGTFAGIEPFGYADPKTRQTVGFDVDLCAAVAHEMGVALDHRGLAVEARIPELNLGRVDILIANLAYSQSRAKQIDYSDAYYLGADMVIVRKDAGITSLEQLAGKRISATKASTSEQAVRIRLPTATPVTFQDASAAYLALQQGKVEGATFNALTSAMFVHEGEKEGHPVLLIKEPLMVEPTGIGVKKGEPALLAEMNRVLGVLEASGELTRLWNKWLGPNTAYGLTRDFKTTPIKDIKFTPLP
ncbi:MAG: transporter substrate-binding domain-containing protein [Janthinobacterium lividum]